MADRKEETTMKKQMTRKQILAVLALIFCLSVSIGGAMAYFTDYEDAAGGAVLHLGGETEIEEGSDARNKDIVIKNTGETNMIVRSAIFGNENEKYMTVTPGSGWTKSSDGFYYYNTVLKPTEQTSVLKAELKTEWKNSEAHPDLTGMEITVVHESSQAIFDADTQKLAVPEGWDAAAVGAITPVTDPQAAGTHS